MSSKIAQQGLYIAATSAADLSDKEGYFVESAGSGAVSVVNSAADVPVGVIINGTTIGGHNTVALPTAGDIVRVKLDASPGTVNAFTKLAVTDTGTAIADAGSGARVLVAQAVEAGTANELVKARLLEPVVFAS